MVVLELNYQKKVGLPGYSSHSCGLTVTTEVSSLNDVGAQVSDLYRRLQDSVDREIRETGWLPNNGNMEAVNGTSSSSKGIQHGANGNTVYRNGTSWACSEKQRGLIERIVDENDINWEDLHQLAQARFSKPIIALNKLEASGLIDEMLEKYGRGGAVNGNGRGHFRSRGRSVRA